MLKVNENSNRIIYSSLLAPPEGFTLKTAVGTTYSLDLETLIAICLALGLSEETDKNLNRNQIYMLNALQKISKKILIFCEAGQIKMPKNPNELNLLLEKMIIPVALPKGRKKEHYPSFHPKIWILQFENPKGENRYRLAVLSRNLTFDRSWDIGLSFEGIATAKAQDKSRALVHFLSFLQKQIKPDTQNSQAKKAEISRLSKALENVDFTTDRDTFKNGFEFMPLCIGVNSYDIKKDPLFCSNPNSSDYTFHELVVFSPFISASIIEDWNNEKRSLSNTSRFLFTRKEELSKLRISQANRFKIYTLKDNIVDGETALSEETKGIQSQDIHAKIYLRKKDNHVDLYMGSMNASYSAVNDNVEFIVKLSTTNGQYNGSDFLRDLFCGEEDGQQNPFELTEIGELVEDELQETTYKIEQVIKAVCRLSMKAKVIQENSKYNLILKIDGKLPDANIEIGPFRSNESQTMANEMFFSGLDILELSEFFRIKVALEDLSLERIIMVSTEGIPDNRENELVNKIVEDKDSFMKYVSSILDDYYLLSLLEGDFQKTGGKRGKENTQIQHHALYEKMLKAALEDPSKLLEIEYLIKMISKDDVIPHEFRELYDTFKKSLGQK